MPPVCWAVRTGACLILCILLAPISTLAQGCGPSGSCQTWETDDVCCDTTYCNSNCATEIVFSDGTGQNNLDCATLSCTAKMGAPAGSCHDVPYPAVVSGVGICCGGTGDQCGNGFSCCPGDQCCNGQCIASTACCLASELPGANTNRSVTLTDGTDGVAANSKEAGKFCPAGDGSSDRGDGADLPQLSGRARFRGVLNAASAPVLALLLLLPFVVRLTRHRQTETPGAA